MELHAASGRPGYFTTFTSHSLPGLRAAGQGSASMLIPLVLQGALWAAEAATLIQMSFKAGWLGLAIAAILIAATVLCVRVCTEQGAGDDSSGFPWRGGVTPAR